MSIYAYTYSSRKDLSSQRLHARFLHPGLVRATFPTSIHPIPHRSFLSSEPTVFENYVHDLYVDDDQLVELSLWDTAGQYPLPQTRLAKNNPAVLGQIYNLSLIHI